ncbi:MAG TPA: nuclear transport factor 2 family protein [Hyphomonadaceae bacterium]|nr:nuclear transport factor 2 family protein [Hyphomonadaceae bacterium]
MKFMTETEARAFCDRWLPAWTGNHPELLAGFYTEDAFYSDPAIPDGVSGRPALIRYFARLLGDNPEWVWTHERAVPLRDGFLNHWVAKAPIGDRTITYRGVCSVQLRGGLIYRNQVFCDTHPFRTALNLWNARKLVPC